MRRPVKIALGCLLAPIGILTLLVILFMGIRMAGVPEPEIADRHLRQDLPVAPPSEPPATELLTEEEPTGDALQSDRPRLPALGEAEGIRVVLEMEEGMFQIVPGPPEQGVQVDAEYDEATYELTQGYTTDKQGRPVYHLRFRSKIHFLRRLAEDGNFDDQDLEANTIRVQLPRGVPMDLILALSKADAEIDLTGLALRNAGLKANMGEFRLSVDEENPIPMEEFAVKCGMGEFRLNGLSRLRAGTLRAEGSMGEMRLDLDGPLLRDTVIDTAMKLGEMRLRLPQDVSWHEEDFKVTWGEASGDLDNPGEPGAPALQLRSTVFMGSMVVGSYHPRPATRSREQEP